LNRAAVQQRRPIKLAQDSRNVRERRPQQTQQLIARHQLALRELRITMTLVRLTTNSRHNPLPRVPTQVQHEVADTVRLLVRPPPDLFVSQTLETAFNLRQVLFKQQFESVVDESFGGCGYETRSPLELVFCGFRSPLMLGFAPGRTRDLIRLRSRQRMSGRRNRLAYAVKQRSGWRPLRFSWSTSSRHIQPPLVFFAGLTRCYARLQAVSMNTPRAHKFTRD
jgi:hypothetical protein